MGKTYPITTNLDRKHSLLHNSCFCAGISFFPCGRLTCQHPDVCENQYFRVRAGQPHGIIDHTTRMETKKKRKSPPARRPARHRPPPLVIAVVTPPHARTHLATTTATSHGPWPPGCITVEPAHRRPSPPTAAVGSGRGTATAPGSGRAGDGRRCHHHHSRAGRHRRQILAGGARRHRIRARGARLPSPAALPRPPGRRRLASSTCSESRERGEE